MSRSKTPSEIVRDGMNKSEHQPMRDMRHCRIGKSLSPVVKQKTESLTRRVASRDIEMVGSARSIVIVAQSVQRIRSRSPHVRYRLGKNSLISGIDRNRCQNRKVSIVSIVLSILS